MTKMMRAVGVGHYLDERSMGSAPSVGPMAVPCAMVVHGLSGKCL
jgi:hypothetical protein